MAGIVPLTVPPSLTTAYIVRALLMKATRFSVISICLLPHYTALQLRGQPLFVAVFRLAYNMPL
jgi:hypothetical protein